LYIIGDNAYVPSDRLLTSFSGAEITSCNHDVYNFHISQLRIKIEQTFGIFVSRFRVFATECSMKLRNYARIISVAAILHNCVVNERLYTYSMGSSSHIDLYVDADEGVLNFLPSDTSSSIRGTSMLRDYILERITERGLARPARNITRNADR
jgi:hypothetical protein